MSAIKHIFRAKTNPTHKELHCLWATLTNKVYEDNPVQFRIVSNGKQVLVVTAEPLVAQSVDLATNSFTYLRAEPQPLLEHEDGQFVQLQGELAYSVHKKSSHKDECPLDEFGRIKSHLKEQFFSYMQGETGVNFRAAADGTVSFAWENRSVPSEKIWLNDVITFSVTAPIVDASRLNTLPFRAIGRRKSYGLGSVVVASASSLALAGGE